MVVSPLLALMQEQHERLADRSVWFRGGDGARGVRGGPRAPRGGRSGFISPEMLAGEAFRARLSEWMLPRRLVIDEAHCVLEWGQGFRPEYVRLGEIRRQMEQIWASRSR